MRKLAAMQDAEPIISVCGDDCAVCPRYLAETDEELHETALFWHRVGWRDDVVSNEEIRCTGCGCRPSCSFALLACVNAHGVKQCRECPKFECAKITEMLKNSDVKKGACEAACECPEDKIKYMTEDGVRDAGKVVKKSTKGAYKGGKKIYTNIREKRQARQSVKNTEKATEQTAKTLERSIKVFVI